MPSNGSVGAGLDLAYRLDGFYAKIGEGGEEQYDKDPSYDPLPSELSCGQSHEQDQGRLPGAEVVMKPNLRVKREEKKGNQGGDQQVELERSAPQHGEYN